MIISVNNKNIHGRLRRLEYKTMRQLDSPLKLLLLALLCAHTSAARPKQYNRATIDEPHGFFSQLDSLSLKDNSIWNTKDTYLLSKKGLVAAPVDNEDEDNEVDLIRKSSISDNNVLPSTINKPQQTVDGPLSKRDEIPEIPISTTRGGIFSSLIETANASPDSDDDEAGSSEGSGAPDDSIKRELMLIVPNSGDNSDISQEESEGGDSGSGDGETAIDNTGDSSISGGGGGGTKETASVEESGSASERSIITSVPKNDVPYAKVDDNVILGEGISTKNKRETNTRPRFVVRNGYVYMKVPTATKMR